MIKIQEDFSDVTQSIFCRPESIYCVTVNLLNARTCTGTHKISSPRLIFCFLDSQSLYLKKWGVDALLRVSWRPDKGRGESTPVSKGKGAPWDCRAGFKNPCLCTFLMHWVEKWEQNQSQVSAITGKILLSKVFNTVKCWYLRSS